MNFISLLIRPCTVLIYLLLFLNFESFTIPRIATQFIQPSSEIVNLLCQINIYRSLQEPILPPLGFQRELLTISSEKSKLLAKSKGNWTGVLANNFIDRFSYYNYRWFAASEIFLAPIDEVDEAFNALIYNEDSFSILTRGNFNHFGGSFNLKEKVWSLTFGRGYGGSTLPNCNTLSEINYKRISAKISRLRRKTPKTIDYYLSIANTPFNKTVLPPGASLLNTEDFVMGPRNSTHISRASRIKQSLSNIHPISWLRRYRSGSQFNEDFDYTTSEVSNYPFDLVKLLCYINYVRSQARPARKPLGANLALMDVARNHTEIMALSRRLVNVMPGGNSIGERLLSAGYDWKAYGQNIARGWPDLKKLLIAQLETQDDREKLLSPGFTSFGAWRVPHGHYWTFLMARGDEKVSKPPKCPPDWDPAFLLEHV